MTRPVPLVTNISGRRDPWEDCSEVMGRPKGEEPSQNLPWVTLLPWEGLGSKTLSLRPWQDPSEPLPPSEQPPTPHRVQMTPRRDQSHFTDEDAEAPGGGLSPQGPGAAGALPGTSSRWG